MTPAKPEPANDNHGGAMPDKPSVRDFKRALDAYRRRGARRGLASRWALRSLPPVEEDEP